ncbi:acyl-CoA dehydratase activase [Natranaerofaba carboxydovora]|uniref:acyl-CoA dehydratase activase n=1 Tax=Natranaerofaba carboxydovora TaxID=2742683 RepID=UPI001F1290FB|nr:acyl-CoA dehydratase activase [Natranaerofaba carboxydovora]UMZ75312.1 (R)-phenyllactate dehydratase activator [Natranaerofaba carboxydovora]
MKEGYLGVDVGSVSTNFVVIDSEGEVLFSKYMRTRGEPIKAVQQGLKETEKNLGDDIQICGVGTTGSARVLTGVIVGADTVKNEITAHAVAASHQVPEVQTVLEIGGQDSKIIILRQGIVVDFAMNTVCAAGTGSFLDHQASRLGVPIEEFGDLALESKNPVRIAGRCSVFAESDMIHKQQMGHENKDIVKGLCQALVRNYLNNVGKGKEILGPVVFQGGVAANKGIHHAFEEALEQNVTIPDNFNVMGAIGAALLAQDTVKESEETKFRGFGAGNIQYDASSFECDGCPNICEIVNIEAEGSLLARWGGRCGKWENIKDQAVV